ncbi:MAG: nitrate/nitrite transporter NrtS [Rhodospirillaceae bacterium]|nr:nitrate/nitrite transporter NrtS [Rhodospirillaceae bacterium]
MTAEGVHRPTFGAIVFERGIVRRSLVIAAIVGTILNLINQGDALLGGLPLVAWKLVLTYCVPYCVSTYGAVTARLEMAKRSARVA